MNRTPAPSPRGVTLIELLIALAITSVLLAALFGVVQSQQTAYFQGHLQRAAQNSARSALAYVEQRLATAGYGMDGSLAFDFQYYGSAAEPMPCPALAAGCPRDSVNGNDELVFYARNPRYWVPDDRSGAVEPRGNAWRVLAVGAGSVTVNARQKDVFEKGRILQVVCKDGAKYAYMTVSQTVGPLLADTPGLSIPLVASVASNPFRRQDLNAADGCLSSGLARAFLIDRFRFHVRPVATGGGNYDPYLVLDRGLDLNNDGPDEAEEVVVAEGIESFQVGYVMTLSTPSFPPRGTSPGIAIAFAPGPTGNTSGTGMTTLQFPGLVNPGQWEYQPTSWYRYAVGPVPVIANERLTDHQANVRGVRVVIVARGADPDPAKRRNEILLPILNQNALPSWIAATVPYNRARVETTVIVRNTTSRGMNDF
jgi:type IV pilus assembly protein PilW